MNRKLKGLIIVATILSPFCNFKNNQKYQKFDICVADSIEEQVNLSTFTDLYKQTVKGVGLITNYALQSGAYVKHSFGSCFFYDQDATNYYIISNYHVVDDANKLSLTLYNNHEIFDGLKVVGYDDTQDVAVLLIPKTNISEDIKILPTSTNCTKGETVYAIGNPASFSFSFTLTAGIIGGVNRIVTSQANNIFVQSHAIQTDAAVNPGNSGGPLFNMNGEVIGVNSLKLAGTGYEKEGINFAYPMEDILHYATLIRTNYTGSAYHNRYRVSLSETKTYKSIYDMTLLERNRNQVDRFYKGIVLLANDTKLALEKGSVITKINGYEINTVVDFRRYLMNSKVNDTVELEVYMMVNGVLSQTPVIITTRLINIKIS